MANMPEFAAPRGNMPYFLRPSVATWLLPLPLRRWHAKLASAGATADGSVASPAKAMNGWIADPPEFAKVVWSREERRDFKRLPSVGSWFRPRFDDQAPKALLPPAEPWKPEFEARFDDFTPAGPTLAVAATPPVRRSASTEPGGAFLFKLAPPPSPVALISVGGSPTTAEVVVIEDDLNATRLPVLSEVQATKNLGVAGFLLHEELLGTNRAEDDIEFSLLGNDSVPTSALAGRIANDGVDSPSDSDAESGSPASTAQARTAAIAPREPPPSSVRDACEAISPSLHAPLPSDHSPFRAGGLGSIAEATRAEQPRVSSRPFAVGGSSPSSASNAVAAAGAASASAASADGPAVVPPVPRASSQLAAEYAAQAAGFHKGQPDASPPSPPQPQPQPRVNASASASGSGVVDIDSLVSSALDRFFGDSKVWPQVEQEVASSRKQQSEASSSRGGERRFRVQVPKPYPGVQYRKSKKLDDRYFRYAENGCTVTGVVEDDGEWLRLHGASGNVFLPMRVGAVDILEPLPQEAPCGSRAKAVETSRQSSGGWFSCCSASAATDAELVIGQAAEWGASDDQDYSAADDATRQGGVYAAVGAQAPPPAADGPPEQANSACQGDSGSGSPPVPHEDDGAGRRKLMPESLRHNALSDLDAANRHIMDPIDPFADTERAERNDRRYRPSSSSPGAGRRNHAEDSYARSPEKAYGASDVFSG